MFTRYRGWIPTVTGRLSFTHFGNCGSPQTRDVNRADPHKRYLLVYQTRNTSDILLPFRKHLGEMLLQLRGELQFVCIAETKDLHPDRQTLLVGSIYIIDRKNIWPRSVRATIVRVRDKLRDYTYTADSPSIEEYFAETVQEGNTICSENCFFQAVFSLHRNGVVDITVNSSMETAQTSPQLPKLPAHRKHVEHILAAQLFFFLKDIGHRHQHHDSRTDTIVDLYNISDAGNDLTWRLSTLYSIYRRIISNKRTQSVNAYFSSLGLLAYAKAFKHICKEQLPRQLHHRLPPFYDEALEESVRASELDMEYRSNTRQERSEKRRNINIAAFGLTLAVLGLLSLTGLKIDAPPHPLLVKLARLCVSEPLLVVTGLAAAIFGPSLQPEKSSKFRNAFYILQPFNQTMTSAIFVLSGILLIAASLCYFVY